MPESRKPPASVHLTVREGKRVRDTRGALVGEAGVRVPWPLPSHWLRRMREGAMESDTCHLTPAGTVALGKAPDPPARRRPAPPADKE